MRIAIPSENPGGLKANRSEHFGHCDNFTVVSLNPEKSVAKVETIKNAGHGAGGCMEPVQLLQDANVDAIVVGGLGARPMQGLAQVGINVYFGGSEAGVEVEAIVEKFIAGGLPRMHADQVCKGSGDCHH